MRPHSNGPAGPAGTLSLDFWHIPNSLPRRRHKAVSTQAARSHSPLLTALETSREANLRRAQYPAVGLKGPKCPGIQGSY